MAIFGLIKSVVGGISALTVARGKRLEGRSGIILQEASGNALQRNWRPLFMYLFWAIIANNYLLVPYVRWMGGDLPILELPGEMWTLITIGMGGYIGTRSVEKAVASFVAGKTSRGRKKKSKKDENPRT